MIDGAKNTPVMHKKPLFFHVYFPLILGYCECSTVADTHYKTFDGEWIHFIGASRFQLAKSDDSETECPFSAYVINKGVMPYKRTIELTIKELEISLLPEKKVLVSCKLIFEFINDF